MSKIEISIDLNKIDKSKIKQHSNGAKYYSITVEKKREPDQYGNTHTVYDRQSKEQREARENKNYLGSGKEFTWGNNGNNNNQQSAPPPQSNVNTSDLPF